MGGSLSGHPLIIADVAKKDGMNERSLHLRDTSARNYIYRLKPRNHPRRLRQSRDVFARSSELDQRKLTSNIFLTSYSCEVRRSVRKSPTAFQGQQVAGLFAGRLAPLQHPGSRMSGGGSLFDRSQLMDRSK